MRRVLFVLASLVVSVAFDAPAADDVGAEVAFDAGLNALAEGDVDRACPLFSRAVELSTKRPIGGLMKLGECWERAGKTASAWSAYREASGLAQQSGDARRDVAEQGVTRLAAVLQRVTIRLDPSLGAREGLVVKVGDRNVPTELLGLPMPVDPGITSVRIELPGVEPRVLVLTLPPPGGTTELAVAPWKEEPLGGAMHDAPRPPQTVETSRFGSVGWAGVALGGGGVALLATALGVAVAADGAYEDALADEDHECNEGACNQAGKEAVDDALTMGDAATGVFLAGAVLTGVGLTMIIVDLATVEETAPAQPTSRLSLRLGMQGLRIEGEF